MMMLKLLFWLTLFLIFYTYIGYGIVLYGLVLIKRLLKPVDRSHHLVYEPEVTLLIAAYNERDCIPLKMENTRKLNYPKNKLKVLWVTDGSDDGSPEMLASYPEVTVIHEAKRSGKIGAVNRAMKIVKTPVTILCDANTELSLESVRLIVKHFSNEKVGCVSGEKRIINKDKESASAAGEGIYWKYESKLKNWDSELYSVVGAAGELFAIRTSLFTEVEPDTILDDFMISLRIAQQGYLIKYDSEAWAAESASSSVSEELKRKIRIAAGGIQSIVRLLPLLNVFRYRMLSFQYISHRVLRWTLAPLCLILAFFVNLVICLNTGFYTGSVYTWMFSFQLLFYLLALAGYYFESRKTRIKVFFIPYFFFIMNYAVVRGYFRFLQKKQTVNWEKAIRA
jgi:cellulose synthase/poly-beta-1,6-N-acetylglucosamine synthase-like glycosyltransferase